MTLAKLFLTAAGSLLLASQTLAAGANYKVLSHYVSYGNKAGPKANIFVNLQTLTEPKVEKKVLLIFYEAGKTLPVDKKDTSRCPPTQDCYNVNYYLSDYEAFVNALAIANKRVWFNDTTFEFSVLTSLTPGSF